MPRRQALGQGQRESYPVQCFLAGLHSSLTSDPLLASAPPLPPTPTGPGPVRAQFSANELLSFSTPRGGRGQGEEGQRGKPRLSQFCGGREAQGGKMGEGTGIFWKRRRLCLSPEKRKALSNICPVGENRQPRGHPLQMASVCLSGGWGVGG